MTAAPVVASAANPAARLSVAKSSGIPASARTAAEAGESKAFGAGVFVLIFAGLAVGFGIYKATKGSSKPKSP